MIHRFTCYLTDRNIAYKPSAVYNPCAFCYWFLSLTSRVQPTLAQLWHLLLEERWNPLEATSCLTHPLQECFFAKVLWLSSWGLLLVIIHFPGRAEERVAKLVDSPDRPESEASYKLDEGGWADVWRLTLSDSRTAILPDAWQWTTFLLSLSFCQWTRRCRNDVFKRMNVKITISMSDARANFTPWITV